MASDRKTALAMRTYHRYLGFFLAGIMAVYAISGIVLIFRDSDLFKKEVVYHKTAAPQLSKKTLPKALGERKLKVTREDDTYLYFKQGSYNKITGEAVYTKKQLPYLLGKMSNFHKAQSGDSLFFLNIFFGLALLFFVISAFWMYTPSTSIFRKGMLFVAAGILLTLILLFV